MLKIGFQSLSYLTATLACITFAYSMESSEIRMIESEYGKRGNQRNFQFEPMERRNAKFTGPLIRFSRRYDAPTPGEHVFGREVRNEAFQKSPLIRFGKRYMSNDESNNGVMLSRLIRQYLQQHPFLNENNC